MRSKVVKVIHGGLILGIVNMKSAAFQQGPAGLV